MEEKEQQSISNTSLRKEEQPVTKKCKREKKPSDDLLAIAPGLQCVPCDRDASLKNEKRFKWRLCLPDEVKATFPSLVADAWVLDNNICVIAMQKGLDVKQVTYPSLSVDGVYGKQKKGAMRIQALQTICIVTTQDDRELELVSPISGRILEMNDRLQSTPSLLQSRPGAEGYLLLLSSDVPKLLDKAAGAITSLDELLDPKKQNVCFAWSKGSCSRGDICKYEHPRLAVSSSSC